MHTDFRKLNCKRAVQLAKKNDLPYVLYDPSELSLFPMEWWQENLTRYDKKTSKMGNWSLYYDASLMPKMIEMVKEIESTVHIMAKGNGFIFSIQEKP
jgi:hypothetical protein